MKKIAILDDGVDFFMLKENVISCFEEKKHDHVHHGTLVLATFLKYTNHESKFYIYDIFNVEDQVNCIINALEDCLRNKVDIIIMSFTLKYGLYCLRINKIMKKLKKSGISMFAAYGNRKDNVYPASSRYVVGVGSNSKRIKKSKKDRYSDVFPEFVACDENYHLFSGTSKATAIVAAQWLNVNYPNSKISKIQKDALFNSEDTIETLKNSINIEENTNLFECGLRLDEIENIILNLLVQYNIKEKCLNMNFKDMTSVANVTEFINNNI